MEKSQSTKNHMISTMTIQSIDKMVSNLIMGKVLIMSRDSIILTVLNESILRDGFKWSYYYT